MPVSTRAARGRFPRWFFGQFFRLLLLVIALAQWVCLTWFATVAFAVRWPGWMHVVGPFSIYLLNRTIAARRRKPHARPPGPAFRLYSAVAFTAVFCFAIWCVGMGGWYLTRGTLDVLSVQALSPTSILRPSTALDQFFTHLITLGMTATALLFAYGYTRGQRRLVVVRQRLAVRGWLLAGPLRIVHITDLHVGFNLRADELSRFVDRVNELSPDLVCITGDIADSPHVRYEDFFPLLARLRARYGVMAVLGNHDHYAGAERVAEELRRFTSIRLLRDQSLTLEPGGGRLHVIGLDDRGPDWARGYSDDARLSALLAEAPAAVPVLLLSHRPDVFVHAARAGVRLTLSGHTHGGQLAVPWPRQRRRNLAEFITPFTRGLYEREGACLYVSCGLGVTAQRIRLFTPREITVLDVCGVEAEGH